MSADTLRFTVDMVPRGKQRARTVKRGSHVGSYTPEETVNAEAEIRAAYRAAFPGRPAFPEGVVMMTLVACFPAPKSFPRWKQERAASERFPHTKKPDVDNIAKLVMDALNGIAYADDSQVWIQSACKVYSPRPRLDVTLTLVELPGRDAA